MTRDVLLAGAKEFNSRRFFEAHEVLEDGLDEADDADWDLVVGLIQIAVGYHKASQGLWSGALLMLDKGLAKIAPYPDDAGTLRLGDLRARAAEDAERVRGGEFNVEPPRMTFS